MGGTQVYRGLNGYAQAIERKDTMGGNAYKGVTQKGPARTALNIRSTVRWDYAPDICKDYKETGFCGYGDSCKFMHDRSDYKLGWQIDAEVDGTGRYGAGAGEARDVRSYQIDDSSDDEDDLPFACLICREPFTRPVVTKCKHYFCEKCALEHYRKSSKCFACGAQTQGVFNRAHDIIKKQQQAQQASGDGNDDGDGTTLEFAPASDSDHG